LRRRTSPATRLEACKGCVARIGRMPRQKQQGKQYTHNVGAKREQLSDSRTNHSWKLLELHKSVRWRDCKPPCNCTVTTSDRPNANLVLTTVTDGPARIEVEVHVRVIVSTPSHLWIRGRLVHTLSERAPCAAY
jgi:hypothetical protein